MLCCLTSHVDRVRSDVELLMGQVPPNGTQQVTLLGQGGLSRIFFWGGKVCETVLRIEDRDENEPDMLFDLAC